ncbi:MAG: metallophosphoesterase [Lachnospiraceae bacterium]|nr:metallophosphoesterase [Lachnospiraceae bacterium]
MSTEAKKLVIVSDTHGYDRLIDQVIERESPFDYLIHCGDAETGLTAYEGEELPYRLLAVRGNCDYAGGRPAVLVERILFYNVLVTHGHRENVRYGNAELLAFGAANHADVVLYGHTHVPEIVEEDGILIVNPGSLAYPKGPQRVPTYAVLTLTQDYDREAVLKIL